MALKVSWRGTTRHNPDDDVMGISFDTDDGNVIRLSLDSENAIGLSESIIEYLVSSSPKCHQRFQDWLSRHHNLKDYHCDHQLTHPQPEQD